MAIHPGSIWLEQNWSPNILPDGQWIAASASGIVEHSPDLDNLYNIIQTIGINFDDIAIAYVWFGEIQ